jgi:hypothetical protein
MPRLDGETDQQWDRRGPYYAIGKRIELNKEFFERSFKFQPRCMAMFGQRAEDIFMLMHTARREIEVASQMLTWKVRNEIGQVPIQDENFWQQCRRAIWDYGDFEPERDKVGNKLKEFRQGMEILCRPVVDLYKR